MAAMVAAPMTSPKGRGYATHRGHTVDASSRQLRS
mgnify:CR=1 FL=1